MTVRYTDHPLGHNGDYYNPYILEYYMTHRADGTRIEPPFNDYNKQEKYKPTTQIKGVKNEKN